MSWIAGRPKGAGWLINVCIVCCLYTLLHTNHPRYEGEFACILGRFVYIIENVLVVAYGRAAYGAAYGIRTASTRPRASRTIVVADHSRRSKREARG